MAFVNMNGTANDEKAHINVTFDECEKITVYRKGQTDEINSDELDIELDNEEGIFVTVSG